jgi:DNA-directed RNA polymerase specialized sigma24 family protein
MMHPTATTHSAPNRPAPAGFARRGTATNRVRTTTTEACDPTQMSLNDLAQRCMIESERFYRGQPHDTSFSYELFRRALVERNDVAWEHIYRHYSPLVDSWVRRSGAFASSGETSEFFVTSAFIRLWRAITPERFLQFPNLPSLLQYLQRCAGCVVIDSVRAQSWAEMRSEEAIPFGHSEQTAPDDEVLDRVSREEFWHYINSLLHDETERVVVHHSFVMGMKPGDIYNERPDLFASVNDVYNVKRNVLGRLGRNSELRQMLFS